MGLTRVYSKIGSILITRFNQAGGPNDKRVDQELDRIFAWAKDAARCIHTDSSVAGNVGTGLDVLHTYTLDTPNRLLTNGDWVRAAYGGELTNNANNKRIQISFDSQVAIDSTLRGTRGGPWRADVTYLRVSSTTVRASGLLTIDLMVCNTAPTIATGSTTEHYTSPINALLTVADLSANAIVMKVEGETGAASNDDVKQNFSLIELRQQ